MYRHSIYTHCLMVKRADNHLVKVKVLGSPGLRQIMRYMEQTSNQPTAWPSPNTPKLNEIS